jgi:hypothetical protein
LTFKAFKDVALTVELISTGLRRWYSELKLLGKEEGFCYFLVLFRNCCGEIEETDKSLNHDRRCPERDWNRVPTEYKSDPPLLLLI